MTVLSQLCYSYRFCLQFQDFKKSIVVPFYQHKNMENMKPMLENAQNMIKGMGSMDIKGLGDMMNKLGGMGQSRGNNN